MSSTKETASISLAEGMFNALFGEGRIGFFSNQELSGWSQTCKAFNEGLVPEFTRKKSKKLMQHVVYGEQDQAEAMIKANPGLLLEKSQATDYSGRIIVGTPFQAALGAEDERMWAMMRPFFDKLESNKIIRSAKEVMKKQFDKQFPQAIDCQSASE